MFSLYIQYHFFSLSVVSVTLHALKTSNRNKSNNVLVTCSIVGCTDTVWFNALGAHLVIHTKSKEDATATVKLYKGYRSKYTKQDDTDNENIEEEKKEGGQENEEKADQKAEEDDDNDENSDEEIMVAVPMVAR